MKRARLCFFRGSLAGVVLSLSAIFSLAQPATETQSEYNLIHLGDVVDVDVLGSFAYDWRGTLTPEGFLQGPEALPDRVFALCRSEQEVAADIAKGLAFLRDPQVAVRVVDRSNRPSTTMFGAVRTPQRFQIRRTVKLNELIVASGGFTDKASGDIEVFRPASLSCGGITPAERPSDDLGRSRYVVVRRENDSVYMNIKISELLAGREAANPIILAGDIITVLESKPIYVIGGVASPRQIATRAEMTVSRAVAGAGGLSRDADPTRVTVYRRESGETSVIETDLEKIKNGAMPDIVLQAYDIVEVAAKGGSKRSYPPIVKVGDEPPVESAKLPMRVID